MHSIEVSFHFRIQPIHVRPHVSFSLHNGKCLYGHSRFLLKKYAAMLVKHHEVDCLVLPGDVCNTCTDAELHKAVSILDAASSSRKGESSPIFPVIGNHEADPRCFAKILTPDHPTGYYSINVNGVHLVDGTNQIDWLRTDLESASMKANVILVFMRYSLLFHPLHNGGTWDNGLQVLDNAPAVLKLLQSHSAVKAATRTCPPLSSRT